MERRRRRGCGGDPGASEQTEQANKMRCPLSSLLSRFLQSLGDGPGAAPRPGAVRQGEQREHAAKGGRMNGVFFSPPAVSSSLICSHRFTGTREAAARPRQLQQQSMGGASCEVGKVRALDAPRMKR